MRPYLIGEYNPQSEDPDFALYPAPRGSSGQRLAKVLDLDARQYLATFERRNLSRTEAWDKEDAAKEARMIRIEANGAPLILLGRRVAEAFGVGSEPFFSVLPLSGSYPAVVLILPHPSGRCLEWNDPGAKARTKELVRILLELGEA